MPLDPSSISIDGIGLETLRLCVASAWRQGAISDEQAYDMADILLCTHAEMEALRVSEQEGDADTNNAWEKDGVRPRTPANLAALGSLEADVLADLVSLRNFLEGRDRAFTSLFGPQLARSNLRIELVRMIVIEFGFGRLRSIEHYQRACAHVGSESAVRGELHLLAELGLTVYLPQDRKVMQIGPSQRLVDWYSNQLPRLMTEVRAFLTARDPS